MDEVARNSAAKAAVTAAFMATIIPLVLFILWGRHVPGRDHYLSLDPKPLNELTEWLVKNRDFWTARVDALEAALRADDAVAVAKKSSSPKAKRRMPK
jgi:hypothetical protein